ncbi:uncharacterized protein SPSK_08132 [Sporothrix schenckii 1099-18]|uniref:Uncharacterized protein n=1 Tax=Sporothrix schenckii 1099-18 TaxID=1397361 RepID=A0A0F2MG15_SPOSC|nr:uncharacterized protein SPSK_08132 [Sporothrix schenckii 1099-18]KJR88643.1 hypothetical protein SPSK_08132 [Sporothrix schenckii 1099-18]
MSPAVPQTVRLGETGRDWAGAISAKTPTQGRRQRDDIHKRQASAKCPQNQAGRPTTSFSLADVLEQTRKEGVRGYFLDQRARVLPRGSVSCFLFLQEGVAGRQFITEHVVAGTPQSYPTPPES